MAFKLNKEGRVILEYYGDNRKELVIKQGELLSAAYEMRTHYEDDVVSESITVQEALGMIKSAKNKTRSDGCCLTKDGEQFYDICVDLCARWYNHDYPIHVADSYDRYIRKEADGTFTLECNGNKRTISEDEVMGIIKKYGDNPVSDDDFYELREDYRLAFDGANYYFFNEEYLERVAKQSGIKEYAANTMAHNVNAEKKRLFVDMDGTLAEFKVVDTLEKLYEPHYFERLKPNKSVVEAVNDINRNHPEIEVYILSAVLSDSKYALFEKKNWLKEHLPEIPEDRCIFPPCGSDKKDFIPDGIRSNDFLLDDYSLNLNSWEPPARGIKLLNGINGNNGTWDKDCVSYLNSSEMLSKKICSIINNDVRITEQRPQDLTGEEKFIAKVNDIAEWSGAAQAKAAERQAEQEKNNNIR